MLLMGVLNIMGISNPAKLAKFWGFDDERRWIDMKVGHQVSKDEQTLMENKKKKKGVLSNPHKLVPIFYGLEAWPPTVTCAHPRPVQKADDDTSKRASFFQEI